MFVISMIGMNNTLQNTDFIFFTIKKKSHAGEVGGAPLSLFITKQPICHRTGPYSASSSLSLY